MINKIKIIKSHKTIPEKFELDLEKMTVITGENNTGKTNFIQAINEKKDGEFTKAEFLDEDGKKIKPKIVYIAAENVVPSDNETKASAKSTALVKNLSELFADLGLKFKLEKQDKLASKIEGLIDETNKNLATFTGGDKHKLDIEIEEKLDSETIVQALIKKISSSERGKARDLNHLGQGTQRIIIASILKAYSDILIKEKTHPEKPILILFEEPEIYLHPKLKRVLNSTLKSIAEQENHQVMITTHDPYFAYTNLEGEGGVLHSFFIDGKGNTDKKKSGVVFGIEDELLYIHLFERVHRKAIEEENMSDSEIKNMSEDSKIDKYLRKYSNGETRENIFPGNIKNEIALPLHARHVIYHPVDGRNKLAENDLIKSIEILNKILSE